MAIWKLVLAIFIIAIIASQSAAAQYADELPPVPPRTYTPSWVPATYSSLPWITTSGTHFAFANGTYVTFHGLDYMGLELHPAFYNQTPQDFEIMASWGFNIVRLPVDWSWIEPEPGEFNQSYLNQVKKVVAMANEYGIYVVIDMHQLDWSPVFWIWGGDNGLRGDGLPSWAVPYQQQTTAALEKDKAYFWSNLTVEQDFASMWEYVASQFANDSGVLGYDLFNEPTTPTNWTSQQMYKNMARVYDMTISAIRKVDQRHIIFFETSGYDSGTHPNNWVEPVDPDHELALEVHDYYTTFNSQAIEGPFDPSPGLAAAIYASQKWDIPLWAGEFGDDPNYTVVRMAVTAFDSFAISWSYWTYFWANWQGYTFDAQGNVRPEVAALVEPYVTVSSSPVTSLVEKTLSNGSIQVNASLAGKGWALVFVPYGYYVGGSSRDDRWVNVSVPQGSLTLMCLPVPQKVYEHVDFNEIGLPSGASWTVTFNGTTQGETVSPLDTFIFFNASRGIASYRISSTRLYAIPSTGTVDVGTSPVIVNVRFYRVALNLSVLTAKPVVGRPIELAASVRLTNGTPVPHANVTLTANGKPVGTFATSSDGVAEIKYVPMAQGQLNFTCYLTGYPELSSPPETLDVGAGQETYPVVGVLGAVVGALAVVSIAAYLKHRKKK
ncbi:glycoside hydrolase family 5 protein [Tardisphaera miroshnichenkoae]